MFISRRVSAWFGHSLSQELLTHAYYSGGLRYQIWVAADGGVFDWMTKLSANRRAVFVASGAGTQLLAARFAP